MRPGTRIKQIIPADGWRAVYAGTDEHGVLSLVSDPLIAWALVTDPSEDEYPDSIEPVADVGGYADVIESAALEYMGVLAPGEDIERYRPDAELCAKLGERSRAKREAR
jgi:hypothetical protein